MVLNRLARSACLILRGLLLPLSPPDKFIRSWVVFHSAAVPWCTIAGRLVTLPDPSQLAGYASALVSYGLEPAAHHGTFTRPGRTNVDLVRFVCPLLRGRVSVSSHNSLSAAHVFDTRPTPTPLFSSFSSVLISLMFIVLSLLRRLNPPAQNLGRYATQPRPWLEATQNSLHFKKHTYPPSALFRQGTGWPTTTGRSRIQPGEEQ